jgi:uncharacterized membrane protein affecting hemolysin expression
VVALVVVALAIQIQIEGQAEQLDKEMQVEKLTHLINQAGVRPLAVAANQPLAVDLRLAR